MKTAPPNNREKDVFERALDVASDPERSDFVREACGPDAELCARVLALLRSHQAGEGFLPEESQGQARTFPLVTEKLGDRIGHYRLREKIGEGGCGIVYLAEQEEPVRRIVALKVIKLGMDTREVVARFEAERQALAMMDHPNIARVFDGGATDTGRPYFVLELVRGIRITDFCDQHQVSTVERVKLFIQVCHAIQHAHQKGIIHRDIKPSNILVCLHDDVPVPKVIDFGIAKAMSGPLTDKTLYTRFEQFMGTPAYMSPEQAGWSDLDIDTQSDIYALGVLLYELLAGRPPFDPRQLADAGLEEMVRRIRDEEPVRPSTRLSRLQAEDLTTTAQRRGIEPLKLISLLRGDLDWIVMKCLEKNRRHRYETVSSLVQDIERHLAHEPVTACPPSTAYRMRKFARRNRMMVTAGAAVALALVLGLVVSAWQTSRARQAEDAAKRNAERAFRAQQTAESKGQESQERLVRLNLANAAQLMKESQAFAALPFLVEALRLEQSKTEQALQRRQLGMVLQHSPKLVQIWFHEAPVNCAAFSPDGRRVAVATGADRPRFRKDTPGLAQMWDVVTGRPVGRPIRHNGGIHELRFSPNGRWIATASADGTARLWDAATGGPIGAPLFHRDGVRALAFSRDGTRLATASSDFTARVWDVPSGMPVTDPLSHDYRVTSLDFTPGGQQLITVSPDGWLRVWDAKLGHEVFSSDAHLGFLGGVQCSPDGRRWVTISGDGTAQLWDAERGKVLATFQHEAAVLRASFSPDGQRIMTASADATARVWQVDTGMLLCSLRHGGAVYDAEFSPDGLAVVTASGDHTARAWDARTGQPLTPSLRHQDKVGGAIFSSDGHQVLTISDDRTACLWELAVGGASLELRHRLTVTSLSLSPDQLRLLTSSADGTAQLWDLRTGQPVGPPLTHLRALSQATFSPDGERLLTASFDGAARVWEAGTGKPVTPLLWHREGVTHAVFSPDGRWVATGSTDKTARVWDATTGNPITPFLAHNGEVQWVAFSPDGKRLVSACRDGLGRVWDVMTGKELVRLTGHDDWMLRAAFGPNGRQILTASADMTARVWDAASGEPRILLLGHSWIVSSAAFSTDGSRILTASYDGTARIWDANTGQAATPPLLHTSRVEQARFSSDGHWVITASSDHAVQLWSAATGEPVTSPIRLGDRIRDIRLSADRQTLIAASGPAAYVWNLAREGRPLSDLQLLSGLLAGETRDALGRVAPLNVKQVWEVLRTKLPESQACTLIEMKAWHRRALAQALEQGDAFAAGFHVDGLLAVEPADESLLRLHRSLLSTNAGFAVRAWVLSNELAEARSWVPPPALGTPKKVIDLSNYFTRPLTEAWEAVESGANSPFTTVTRGVQELGGVTFDVRGLVQLGPLSGEEPERLDRLRIGRACRRLHFLHGTFYSVSHGTEIAQYVIHYADGQQCVRPVRYGYDVRNFFALAADRDLDDTSPAWTEANPIFAEHAESLRIYRLVWDNPRPSVAVESIDFISSLTRCAPFLIAITAEE
jgi:eukaryotic-like serine/threonine-protein kinase